MAIKKHNISVCIIARPNENIKKCLGSIKNQTYGKKEIVVYKEFNRNFAALRNKVIEKAKGDIIVFLDSDCHAERHWLEEVNKIFQDRKIVGFWGRVCYELDGKMPTISTRIISNDGNGTLTANAGFKADLLKKEKFDTSIRAGEDKAINKRMRKHGKIIYSDKTIVFHTKQKWSFDGIIKHATKYIDNLKLYYKYKVPVSKMGPIIYPEHYLILLFPPLILLFNSIRSFYDLKIAVGNYLEKVYARFLIWKFAIKYRKFII